MTPGELMTHLMTGLPKDIKLGFYLGPLAAGADTVEAEIIASRGVRHEAWKLSVALAVDNQQAEEIANGLRRFCETT